MHSQLGVLCVMPWFITEVSKGGHGSKIMCVIIIAQLPWLITVDENFSMFFPSFAIGHKTKVELWVTNPRMNIS